MMRIGGWHLGVWLAAAAAWESLCGCIAANVGDPQIHRHATSRTEVAARPVALHVEAARGRLTQEGDSVTIGIEADVREEYPRTRWDETVTVRVQKRLAFGLFPAASELYLMPKGALDSGVFLSVGAVSKGENPCALYTPGDLAKLYPLCELIWIAGTCGIIPTLGTLNALLFEPVEGWSCDHAYLDKSNLVPRKFYSNDNTLYSDPSQAPKMRAILEFPRNERARFGFRTPFDACGHKAFFSHSALVGWHKYVAVFVEPAVAGPREDDGFEAKRRQTDIDGPWEAVLTIPALKWTGTARSPRGGTRAECALPQAEKRCITEAVLSFRPAAAGVSGVSVATREALRCVQGKTYRFDVTLEGRQSQGTPSPTSHPSPRPPTPQSSLPYTIVGIHSKPDGQYEVRVAIADRTKTFDIGWALETSVRQKIREDFVNRHPGTGIQYVREIVEWGTEEDGSVLVYRGWGFSARPLPDGWHYDHDSRRGFVRLRISGGMPPELAKIWARDNIEAIVVEKNVQLTAGKAPPPGAKYRSLSENFENGILTIEFTAEE